ncbi:MAG: signal peptidase II [Bdellovibrionota bacterium]
MFKNKRILSILYIIVLLGLDQVTKWGAVLFLKDQGSYVFLNNFFRLEYAENKGAFLSLGAGMSDTMRFVILNLLVTVVILWLLWELLKKTLDPIKQTSYILIVSGGVGNLVDRYFQGYVVDFANMGFGSIRTGIFNLADVYIMMALFLLLTPEKWTARLFPPKVQLPTKS